MYDPGKGVFNEVSGSLHNIPMHMQDNGRVSPQMITPGVSQIYNPAFEAMNMSNSMLGQNLATYGGSSGGAAEHTGSKGFYQTQIHNAAMYSTYAAEKAVRNTRDNIAIGKNVTSLAGVASMLMGASTTQIWNPVGWAGMALGGGLMAADYMMESGDNYYRGFQNRIADINGIKNVMQGANVSAIMNPATGRVSDTQAMKYQSMISNIGNTLGIDNADMQGMNSMAASSGMLQGHGGSIGQLGARLRSIAKVTKSIMDISAGISAGEAMEIQRLSESLDMSSGTFSTMDIGKRLVSAAKVSGRSLADMGAVMQQGAALSQQAGLGMAVGSDIALFNNAFVGSAYGGLTAGQMRKVGSKQQFAQVLNAAHTRFTKANIGNIIGQTMFVNPATGEMEIDDAAMEGVQMGRVARRASTRRIKALWGGDNAAALKAAGVSSKYVKSLWRYNQQELSESAANAMAPEARMRLMLQDAMSESGRKKMDVREVLVRKYGKQGADALMAQADAYEKSAAGRSMDAYKQNIEYHAQVVARGRIDNDAVEITDSERAGRVSATMTATLAERAQEEAIGIFRRTSGRDVTLSEFDAKVGGGASGRYKGVYGRSSALRGYNTYLGAKAELDLLKEDSDMSDLRKGRIDPGFFNTLVGKRFKDRYTKGTKWNDFGMREGLGSLLTEYSASSVVDEWNPFTKDKTMLRLKRLSRDDLRGMEGLFTNFSNQETVEVMRRAMDQYGEDVTAKQMLADSDIMQFAPEDLKIRLEALSRENSEGEVRDIAAGAIIARVNIGDQDIGKLYASNNKDAYTKATDENNLNATKLDAAVHRLNTTDDPDKYRLKGGTEGLTQLLKESGFTTQQLQGQLGVTLRAALVHKIKEGSGNTNSKRFMSQIITDNVGAPNPFSPSSSGFEVNLLNETVMDSRDNYWHFPTKDNSWNNATGENVRARDFLFGKDSTETETMDAEGVRERLISLGRGVKVLGGGGAFKRIYNSATRKFSKDDAYNYENLKKLSNKDFIQRIMQSDGVTGEDKKRLKHLLDTGGEEELAQVRQVLSNAARTGKGGGEDAVKAVDKTLDRLIEASALEINTVAVDKFKEDIKDTGYEGIFGTGEDTAAGLRKFRGGKKAASMAAFRAGTSSRDYAAGYETLGVDFKSLGEEQQQELRSLYKTTVINSEGASMEKFQAGLQKILSGAAAGKGGGSGKTAEDPTLSVIRKMQSLIAASSTLLLALTKPKEEGKKMLDTAAGQLKALSEEQGKN